MPESIFVSDKEPCVSLFLNVSVVCLFALDLVLRYVPLLLLYKVIRFGLIIERVP